MLINCKAEAKKGPVGALSNEKLARKVDQLEMRVSDHDEVLIELVQEIRKLIESPNQKVPKQKAGFINSIKKEKRRTTA
ncbi:MAG: hypothetical protein C4519_21740 [Desulfobacteraceae bacterium]|nr:MAG: hypothetical protein C4519_21740 [Desulfobacteraceae bacterium]